MSKSKTDIWIPLYIGDYLADTIGLDFAEHGAYMLALFAYWRKGGPLSDYELKKTTKEYYGSVSQFFELSDDLWHHKRVDSEIEKSKAVSKSLSIRGAAGASKRWQADQNNGRSMQRPSLGHCSSNAQAMLDDAQSQSQSQPHTQPHAHAKNTAAVRPDFLSQKVWDDFIALRKSKRAPLTTTAFDRIQTEAKRSGWTLENALRECCARGWQSFKAEWVTRSNGGGYEASIETVKSTIDRNTDAIKRHIEARNSQPVDEFDRPGVSETLGELDDGDAFDALVGESERFE